MSRPPIPQSPKSTGREQSGDLQKLDYLPLEYADLLALEQDLAVTRLGRPRAGAQTDEADVTQTFMELSALVGHVLSVYQRQRAGEAYISTAQAPSSLVRHAHRLAYDPDPGVAASGHVVLFAKDGVAGTVPRGLALASTPLGDIKAQDYETRDDLAVDAAVNELIPVDATTATRLAPGDTSLWLDGVGHGLAPGDLVALEGNEQLHRDVFRRVGLTVTAVSERDGLTQVRFDRAHGFGASHLLPTLYADPALRRRSFGADADPTVYPPGEIAVATGASSGTSLDVVKTDGTFSDDDVLLDRAVEPSLVGDVVVTVSGTGGLAAYTVASQTSAAVTLKHTTSQAFARKKVHIVTRTDGTTDAQLVDDTGTDTVSTTSHVSARVTALTLRDVKRKDLPFPATFLADWQVSAEVARRVPHHVALSASSLELPGELTGLTPGRPLVLTNRAETVAQVVTITRTLIAGGTTTVFWDASPGAPTFLLDDLKVFGNVVRVSHGRTVRATLGGSDGVTAFQRFELREHPVTVLPGAAGGEPEIEVRVDDVLWARVTDFADALPDDRVYRAVTDERGVTTVVFGDGRNGAVPPSGAKNITAVYRVGLGVAGDVEPRRLSRLKRAHPLVDHIVNATALSGGAEPAGPAAVRSQSTRWIRTFDRAVSVADLADLALTLPGIARAAARDDQALGVTLVVATADGGQPPLDAVRTFLDLRRDTSVRLQVIGPGVRDVKLGVSVDRDPAYLPAIVDDALRAALHGEGGLFTFEQRGLGQPAYLSEVYARLEAVAGVSGVRVDTFNSRGTVPLADVIPAGVDEWLRLLPTALTLGGAIT